MKKQSNRSSALLNLHLRIGLFVFLAGIILSVPGNAFTQPRSAKPTQSIAQRQNLKSGVQQPNQGFWAQTNGPQGGDGITLATSPSGHIFVGTQGGGVFRSTDNGGTWTGVSNGITDTNVRALAI